jgi:hypothetical protein
MSGYSSRQHVQKRPDILLGNMFSNVRIFFSATCSQMSGYSSRQHVQKRPDILLGNMLSNVSNLFFQETIPS